MRRPALPPVAGWQTVLRQQSGEDLQGRRQGAVSKAALAETDGSLSARTAALMIAGGWSARVGKSARLRAAASSSITSEAIFAHRKLSFTQIMIGARLLAECKSNSRIDVSATLVAPTRSVSCFP